MTIYFFDQKTVVAVNYYRSVEMSRTSMKKMVSIPIRNFRGIPEVSDVKNREKWAFVESQVSTILNDSNCGKSLEELYGIVQDLHLQKFTPLISQLEGVIENFLDEKVEGFLHESPILSKINTLWQEFSCNIKILKNIFLYYDRYPNYFSYNGIQNTSWALFSRIIIKNPVINKQIITQILSEIKNERNGEEIDGILLKSVIEMLQTLQLYENCFLNDFLKESREFYNEESKNRLETSSIPEYLTYVNKRISQEQNRVSDYLNKHTENQILDIIYKELVEKHVNRILCKGFDDLLQKNMFEELTLLYRLFQKIQNGSQYLINYFRDFIVQKGMDLTDLKNEKNMIQDLLSLMDDLEKIILICFDHRKDFYDSIRKSFKTIINNCNTKVALLLAKFLDNKLKAKDTSDEDLELILGNVLKLFKFVQGKDIFEAFYKKHLAKRLLLGKSANRDAENSMISKLKEECGGAFTSNIEGMFQDINLSRDINSSFKQKVKNQEYDQNLLKNSDFSVNVLTNSYWPSYPTHNINLPVELVNYQQIFQEFYLSNHSGRKLFWQPSLGHCLIRASFDCGVKELQVSLFQAVVLLLYNTSVELKFKEIQEMTSLDPFELKRTLLSLACGKSRVLVKNPKGKDIDDDDAFIFNEKFTDKLFRVRINQIQLQETLEEESETQRHVLVDRQFQIDAAIVRVMKHKKTIKHNVLVKELYNILEIPVNQTDLKKRIELLIEREYMERDKRDKSNYIYIA